MSSADLDSASLGRWNYPDLYSSMAVSPYPVGYWSLAVYCLSVIIVIVLQMLVHNSLTHTSSLSTSARNSVPEKSEGLSEIIT